MASGYDKNVEYDINHTDFKFKVFDGFLRLYDDYSSVLIYDEELRSVGEKLIELWMSGATKILDEDKE